MTILDGYIRVSQVKGREGERFISPKVQRDQIEGYARLHALGVGEVQPGQSGHVSDGSLVIGQS